MKILHISDLHYKEENKSSINRIIDALIEDVRKNFPDSVDIIVFSGDLSYSGDEKKHIIAAYENSVRKIAVALNVSDDKIFLCQGNHDISRKEALSNQEIIEKGILEKIKDRNSLNKLLEENESEKYSDFFFKRIINFYEAISNSIKGTSIYKDPLLQIDIVTCDEKKYGIYSFNTSWRSTGSGEADRKKLLLGEHNIQRALNKLNDVDMKIAILHHPFEWLAEFDRKIVEPLMLGNFDLILQGHIHSSFPEGKINSLGNCIIAQCGCLYQSPDYANYYQIIDINLSSETIDFDMRTWFDSPRFVFDKAVNVSADGTIKFPLNLSSERGKNPTAKLSLQAREVSRFKANQHVSFDENNMEDFEKTFICPPLSPVEGDE
ncbi:phosphohydrolase [Acetobacter orientalis]|uniref:Phosphohydrolase n=1 Tax=Acetobacter orientalis TaxID=146474 RepID=A0A2Z5ZHU6_9PROT|nr:phosphohydrolase [Acetobacter orientalis]